MRNSKFLCAAVLCAVGSFPGAAAQADLSKPAAPQTELKRNPLDQIQDFDAAADEPYTLGGGDEITIDVAGHVDLGGKNVVGPDGAITLPLAGPLRVAGLSREEAAKAIQAALLRYYTDIEVTVRIDKYASNRIILVGRVLHPGVVIFDRTPTLLDVITEGGGLNTGGVGTDSIPMRCAIFRGKDQVLWVDLRALLDAGNLAANVRLKRNDVVYVPSDQDEYVSVLGEVAHPGAFKITPKLALVELLAEAGGITQDGAENKISLIRPSTGVVRLIAMKEILSPNGLSEAGIMKGDVVYVPKRGLAKVGYVLQHMSPATSLLTLGAAVR